MTTRLGELDLQSAAKQAAGNWQEFQCFAWFRKGELNSPEDWGIFYTHHRDSTLLDQSNASVIERDLQPFTEADDPDVVPESHNHWAVGWIDGFSIRVFRNGEITAAFRRYHELAERLAEYPILDEEDYSRRELEATLENLSDAAWSVKDEYDLPEEWQDTVYDWLSDNQPAEVENTDDQGGYPSETALREAFDALGFQQTEVVS